MGRPVWTAGTAGAVTGLTFFAYIVAGGSDLGGAWLLAMGGIVASVVATCVLLVLWIVRATGQRDR